MVDTTLVSIRLPNALCEQVDDIARTSRRSRSFVVKEAVQSYLDEKQAYLAAIEEALGEADDGVFVSGEAVDRWLRSWGSEDLLPMPEPEGGEKRKG